MLCMALLPMKLKRSVTSDLNVNYEKRRLSAIISASACRYLHAHFLGNSATSCFTTSVDVVKEEERRPLWQMRFVMNRKMLARH